jgi:hypothetical protein
MEAKIPTAPERSHIDQSAATKETPFCALRFYECTEKKSITIAFIGVAIANI